MNLKGMSATSQEMGRKKSSLSLEEVRKCVQFVEPSKVSSAPIAPCKPALQPCTRSTRRWSSGA